MKKSFYFLFLLTSFSAFSQTKFLEFKSPDYEQVYVQGFVLDETQDVSIRVVSLSDYRFHYDHFSSSAWILNSATREVVWELDDAHSKEIDADLDETNATVNLPKGTYEAYFAQYPGYYDFNFSRGKYNAIATGHFLGSLLGSMFSKRHYYDDDYNYESSSYYRKLRDKMEFTISGKGKTVGESVIEGLQTAYRKNAFINFQAKDDNGKFESGFVLTKPTEVEVYAFGEIRRDENYDFGWIMNTQTNEKIWELDYHESEYGGGADKNRFAKTTLTLPAGKYVAFYTTDDSHSPEEWNSPPPFDPNFWGMIVRAKNESDLKAVKTYDYRAEIENSTLINLTKARDNEYLSKGFTLTKPTQVRVVAVGEGKSNDMYDYGWIVNAKTHEAVWKMKYRDTENAGGASKNRIADVNLKLDKGDYIVYYVTDGSHSYRDWNENQPANPEDWGIRVLLNDDKVSKSDVKEFNESESSNYLAQIVRVRDHAHKSVSFKLDKPTRVRVYAIGEGDRNEMYDYGWIENNKNNDVVWEMTYRKTENAGGAKKNRLVDATVLLDAGSYTVYYETDGSHSFNDWNDDPPFDAVNYGITVSVGE